MLIKDLLNNKQTHFSFEYFPPKKQEQEESFFQTVEELNVFKPLFASVTYGAMGSNQEKSLRFVDHIQNTIKIETLAHFTCIGTTKENIDFFLEHLKKSGIYNILALRGDIPEGVKKDEVLQDFTYASDLVKYIKQKEKNRFSIGVAGYPEGHKETPDKKLYLEYLKRKVDEGADYIITQLFFENKFFFDFCNDARKAGINVPILPGIMPISNFKMIETITKMCGAKIPNSIIDFFSQQDISREDIDKFALENTFKQCKELVDNGFRHIHFCTLNKSSVVKDVCKLLI